MALEITKEHENTPKECYVLKFVYNEETGHNHTMRMLPGTYKMLEDYFFKVEVKVKVKREKKQPAPAPKIEDVKEYFKVKGYSNEAACKFFEYYETTGWRGANGNPILNWKAKCLAVWFTDKNKIKENTSTSSFFR